MEWWLRTCIYEININEKKQRVATIYKTCIW